MTRAVCCYLVSEIFSIGRPILHAVNALLDRKASLPISAVLSVGISNSVLFERQVMLSNHTSFLVR